MKAKLQGTRVVRGVGGLVAALAVILGIAASGILAPSARAATYLKYDDMSGEAATIPGISYCIDGVGCPMSASGTVACSVCTEGQPSSGAFSLNLTFITHPPSPCKVKSVSGALSITWDNGLTSTASLDGRFIDGKPILTLSGSFSASDPTFASAAFKAQLNNFPPNPCLAATNTISGLLAISTNTN